MAYVPSRFVDLINKYTSHTAHLFHTKQFSFGDPWNLVNNFPKEVRLLHECDVLHYHGSRIFDAGKLGGLDLASLASKPKILHYHGSPQRENPEKYQRSGVPLLVSTPEMLPLFPGSQFFPNLIDETDKLYTPKRQRDDGLIKICHHFSPHPARKDTELFLKLQREWPKESRAKFVSIPSLPLTEALRQRAECDFVFDHLQGYYGCISIEAMAQGVPPINDVSDFVMGALCSFFGVEPPFVRTRNSAYQGLLDLVEGIEKCQSDFSRLGERCREFMEKYWSGKVLIHKLIDIYKGLLS